MVFVILPDNIFFLVLDWSDYTPKKLQSRKHKVLQTKRKRTCSADSHQDEQKKIKTGTITAKKRLLEEETLINKEYHEIRIKREQLHIHQIILQNEKLELEIEILKRQLNNSS